MSICLSGSQQCLSTSNNRSNVSYDKAANVYIAITCPYMFMLILCMSASVVLWIAMSNCLLETYLNAIVLVSVVLFQTLLFGN